MTNGFDTIVVGAGASGLAAASELAAAGQQICILEARDRLGGRMWTRYEPELATPIELGAEFIHGRPPVTLGWIAKSHGAMLDAAHGRFQLLNGQLQHGDDMFAAMRRGLSQIKRPRRDLPLSEFLEHDARGKLSPPARRFARALVEGFDAADATRVSTLAILDEWSGVGAADSPTFRPLGGYGMLIRGLAGSLDPLRAQLQLDTVVREIRWRRGHVAIEATRHEQALTLEARQAVITLPLGVLQFSAQGAGAVRFTPALPAKQRALGGLATGPVIKVNLRFRQAFWEQLDGGRYWNGSFFFAPEAPFRTFWTTLPLRTALLTAWAAGPNATRLAGMSSAEIVRIALDSLEILFGKRTRLRSLLEAAYLHDWQSDPFARGAYSYVTAGGGPARKALAAPVQGTLFFAGEATNVGGESGTVAGALQTGHRAARQVLAAS